MKNKVYNFLDKKVGSNMTEIKKQSLIMNGKSKSVFNTNDSNIILIKYEDSITAFNNKRKNILADKGKVNCQITDIIFNLLKEQGIKTHIIKKWNESSHLCQKLKMLPLEVIVRNYAKGSIVRRLGIDEYFEFKNPIIEFSYKNDKLGDPMISIDEIIALKIATPKQITKIKKISFKINTILTNWLKKNNITLLDFKIEFGLNKNNVITLGDELSPDCMRLENMKNKTTYDKDIYRFEKGDVMQGYKKFLEIIK